jgi:hypothetical protein
MWREVGLLIEEAETLVGVREFTVALELKHLGVAEVVGAGDKILGRDAILRYGGFEDAYAEVMGFDHREVTTGIGDEVVEGVEVTNPGEEVNRFARRRAGFEDEAREEMKGNAGLQVGRFYGEGDVETDEEARVVDAVVAPTGNGAAHPHRGTAYLGLEPHPLAHALDGVKVIVAPHADVTGNVNEGEGGATAFGIDDGRVRGAEAHGAAAHAAQKFCVREMLAIGVAAQFVEKRRVDVGDVRGALGGESEFGGRRPPRGDGKTLGVCALREAELIVRAGEV